MCQDGRATRPDRGCTDDHPASVIAPVGREEAGQRRDKHNLLVGSWTVSGMATPRADGRDKSWISELGAKELRSAPRLIEGLSGKWQRRRRRRRHFGTIKRPCVSGRSDWRQSFVLPTVRDAPRLSPRCRRSSPRLRQTLRQHRPHFHFRSAGISISTRRPTHAGSRKMPAAKCVAAFCSCMSM